MFTTKDAAVFLSNLANSEANYGKKYSFQRASLIFRKLPKKELTKDFISNLNLKYIASGIKSRLINAIDSKSIANQVNTHKHYLKRDLALKRVEVITNYLEENNIIYEIVGSFRRGNELVGDLDIIIIAKSMPRIPNLIYHSIGESKCKIILDNFEVDMRCSNIQQFPFMLLYFTGSKENNINMRAKAKSLGLKLNEYGLFNGDKLIECKNEKEIYEKLNMKYLEPNER